MENYNRRGFFRCAAPGCPSRAGQGKLFKYSPKNLDIRNKWLEQCPPGVKVSVNTALCEDHFDQSQFEKPRQDGRKKLKSTAVPSIFVNCCVKVRRPFADVSNTYHESQPTVQSPKHNSTNHGHYDAAISLLTLRQADSAQPSKPMVQQNLEHTNDITEATEVIEFPEYDVVTLDSNKVENLLSLQEPPDVQTHLYGVYFNDSNQILDESTGEFKILTPESIDRSIAVLDEPEIASFHDSVILNESTGCFDLTNTTLDSTLDLDREVMEPATIEDYTELVAHQTAEIARLREEKLKDEAKIQELVEESKWHLLNCDSGAFRLKYDALRASKNRLEEKVRRDSYSPWLRDSQLARIKRKCNRGLVWDPEDIQDGLILKMQCGSSGYSNLAKKLPLLPALRTLQQSVQFVRFESGMLQEVFDLMSSLVKGMKDIEKDCEVVLDEMAIMPELRYCQSLKKWVGNCTLPSHEGLATKALTVLLAGITRRWKIAVHVEFTNKKSKEARNDKNNPTGKAYANIIESVIVKAETIGLKVCGVTSDMGPDNLAFWRQFNIIGSREKNVQSSFNNPVRENAKIYIVPDPVHIMKSIKTMLESNGTVTLPDDVVEEEGLTSRIVDYNHLDDLMEFESGSELKVAFRLKEDKVHCRKQFSTMNVGTTKAVICHRTGVALNLLANEKSNPTYETTAWFFIFLNTVFALLTCRHRGLAISKHNQSSYEKAIGMIKKFDYLFQNMSVGSKGDWKPVQRGIKVLCNSVLGLIEYFLGERNYKYLMLGRFTGDCIENTHSIIRQMQAVPHAVAFLQCLKVVTLAQYSQAVRGASYEYEGDVSPLGVHDFLAEARQRAKDRATTKLYDGLEELFNNPMRKMTDNDFTILTQWEKWVIYDMAGAAIVSLKKANVTICNDCLQAVMWKEEGLHPAAVITDMKEFVLLRSDNSTSPRQIYVSSAVYRAILMAEVSFRLYRDKTKKFKNTDVKQYFVGNLTYVWDGAGLPNCHQIGRKILDFYITGRAA